MDARDDSYSFSQSFEVKILAKDKIVQQINDHWRAKKVGLDIDADRAKAENQSRIEFYAFTGVKLGEMTLKDRLSSRSFQTALSKYEAKSEALNKKEIKRMEDAEKAAEGK